MNFVFSFIVGFIKMLAIILYMPFHLLVVMIKTIAYVGGYKFKGKQKVYQSWQEEFLDN